MPLTRSASSKDNQTNNSKDNTTVTSDKAPKRKAQKEVKNVPPKKIIKKPTEKSTEVNSNKVIKSLKKQKEEVEQSEDTTDVKESDDEPHVNAKTIYEFTANDIKGNPVSLEKYKGNVCIIVNVASRCGHTKSNYEQLTEIFDKYSKDKGLRILAFPCNQFGKQEPGDNDKICEFAKKRNVNFDMFEKVDVNGKNAHPLWKFLSSQIEGPKGSKIAWNFTKFIINKDGEVVERHIPSKKPIALVENLEKYW